MSTLAFVVGTLTYNRKSDSKHPTFRLDKLFRGRRLVLPPKCCCLQNRYMVEYFHKRIQQLLTPPPPRIYLPVNVTAIKVYFDCGAWYNYTFSTPVRMEPLEVKVFNVGNTTPPLTNVPETWVHSYTVYVEYVHEGDTAPLM
ncbi:MAG: hypothetical protein ACUVQL_01865, partial [Candidatus Bathycorpusculaceae bacterium]